MGGITTSAVIHTIQWHRDPDSNSVFCLHDWILVQLDLWLPKVARTDLEQILILEADSEPCFDSPGKPFSGSFRLP